ncbi:MAG: hypothetical protein HW387_1440 [Parachlamydiales bacterium]|nr:hypothetical protein [Parachlamydiales bacterium]
MSTQFVTTSAAKPATPIITGSLDEGRMGKRIVRIGSALTAAFTIAAIATAIFTGGMLPFILGCCALGVAFATTAKAYHLKSHKASDAEKKSDTPNIPTTPRNRITPRSDVSVEAEEFDDVVIPSSPRKRLIFL